MLKTKSELQLYIKRHLPKADNISIRDMITEYSKRPYHNHKHIIEMLNLFDSKFARVMSAEKQFLVRVAIIFHDVVYDPTEKIDSEKESAKYATDFLTKINIENEKINKIYRIILDTKIATRSPSTQLSSLVNDIDLYVGVGAPNYMQKMLLIAKEYGFVSKDIFVQGRIKFLKNLLNKRKIYNTNNFTIMEKHTRENIDNEIKYLETKF